MGGGRGPCRPSFDNRVECERKTEKETEISNETEATNNCALMALFHHVHHCSGKEHEVHHCGREHDTGYEIEHCSCGLHAINVAIITTLVHAPNEFPVTIQFTEKCPDRAESWWHIESGVVISKGCKPEGGGE